MKTVSTDVPVSVVVANQLCEHYFEARDHIKDLRTSPARHTWLHGAIFTACAEVVVNTAERIAVLKSIDQQEGEKAGKYRVRLFKTAGISFGPKSNTKLKEMIDYWNRHKHGGTGDEWKTNIEMNTEEFAVESFNLAGLVLAAFYRVCHDTEADWIEWAKATKAEISLSPIKNQDTAKLLKNWDIHIKT